MNDRIDPAPFPDEATLHAYVDGQLDQTGYSRMEAWLDRHPARAEEIRRWRQDAQQLRAAFGSLPGPSGSTALDPATIRVRRRRRVHARIALAAGLVLTLAVGGVGGWQARSVTAATATAPMADARQAYRMFASRPHMQFDATQQRPGELQGWLDRHFRNAAALPNLAGAGFHPVGGRLLATASGPAAMVLYEDPEGRAISFYIRPPSRRAGSLPHGERRDGRLATAYWSGNGYNYALVSRADAPDMQVIRKASLQSSI